MGAALVEAGDASPILWSQRFASVVDRRLDVPPADQKRTLAPVERALSEAGLQNLSGQAFVVVDRSPQAQVAMVIFGTAAPGGHGLGASRVSAGMKGTFEPASAGQDQWVLNPQRRAVPWPGRHRVIVDSQAAERPSWSPLPGSAP